jgi:hypothetical protein
VEVWLKLAGGNEPIRLPDDSSESASVQLPVSRNGQDLTPGRRGSDQLDVAAVLGDDAESEVAEDADDIVADSLRSFGIRRLHLDRHEQSRALPQTKVRGIFTFEVERDRPAQVLDGLIDGGALRHDRDLQALTDKSGLVASANRGGDVLTQLRHRFPQDNCSASCRPAGI